MQAAVHPSEACCPDEACGNHGLGVSAGKPFYSSFGKTDAGSQRWKCMACQKTLSVAASSTSRQRDSHKNKLIFKLLMNKMPLRRICEVAEMGPNALYGKIDFIWRQCMAFAAARDDVENAELPEGSERLPEQGMQIHSEYTLYGHFLHLKKLTAKAEKVRFFLDQDSGMRAACLAAVASDIKHKRLVDAFFVSINKEMTVDQKRRRKGEAAEALRGFMEAHPALDESKAILEMIKEAIAKMPVIGGWSDKWLKHPFPNMSEPEKAIAYLTDMGDYDADHLAWLYNKASLHSTDSLFMQIRRRLMLLERGIHSSGNAGRVWNGYAPYNPQQIGKMLGIFRVFHKFMLEGDDGLTPAMRLGLAKGPVSYEDVLYFTQARQA